MTSPAYDPPTGSAEDDDEPVVSPCINVCRLDRAGNYCEGCFRSLAEITAWSRSSDKAKRDIVVAAERRRHALQSGGSAE